jgi:hypothetical protein
MKKIIATLAAGTAVLAIAGCQQAEEAPAEDVEAPAEVAAEPVAEEAAVATTEAAAEEEGPDGTGNPIGPQD